LIAIDPETEPGDCVKLYFACMKFFADLHIHSAYSRATSKELTLENLWIWGQKKGLSVVGTGDCIHPKWLDEIEKKLVPSEEGLYALADGTAGKHAGAVPESCRGNVRFIMSVEISSIYKRDGKVRKVHNVICLPSIASARALQSKLSAVGNIHSDGRPILGLDSRDLLKMVLDIEESALFIPAHIWTPWFSVLGSKSGFDSIEECFGDLSRHIYAIETGLSSDPPMNRRLTRLDRFALVSNSDAHSPSKLGREATIFDCVCSFGGIRDALKNPAGAGLVGTVEFFPEEGKYHYDGHRACKTRLNPIETRTAGGACPVCGKPVTVGVMSRVEELADRKQAGAPRTGRLFSSCIPLAEIISQVERKGVNTARVQATYGELLDALGNEFRILLDAPLAEIARVAGAQYGDAIDRMRRGDIHIEPGYDGEFGVVEIYPKGISK
jgi:DNA helicase II / ATP-dependent DNA helicase PcrA